jgi:hypothetical protein
MIPSTLCLPSRQKKKQKQQHQSTTPPRVIRIRASLITTSQQYGFESHNQTSDLS